MGKEKSEIYFSLQNLMISFLNSFSIEPTEISKFDRLLKGNIVDIPENKIQSTGYVVHTLETAIWCLLKTDNYKSAVLKAVNLGIDSDTTGAVTGGLAGLLYGYKGIPQEWTDRLVRRIDIEDLAVRLGITRHK